MASGADMRQALEAGLWKALVDDSDRAAMRATCADARSMADALHDTAVLPVGPGTWDSAGAIAAYHRRLGGVQSLHVRYSCSMENGAQTAQFMEAYCAALGAALPACHALIKVPAGRHLPMCLVAVVLQRVMPHVERLDIAMTDYGRLTQLLTLMEPCTRLRSLRLLPARGPTTYETVAVALYSEPRVLEALCRLRRLHTLSGPWCFSASELARVCAAMPGLTTLGCLQIGLYAMTEDACLSQQLHTLTGWCCAAGADAPDSQGAPIRPWRLFGHCTINGVGRLMAALPALQRLEAVDLEVGLHWWNASPEELLAVAAITQRFAACADQWALNIRLYDPLPQYDLHGVPLPQHDLDGAVLQRGLPPGSLAPMRHLEVSLHRTHAPPPAVVASVLDCLALAAPSITTLKLRHRFRGLSREALRTMVTPLRRAAHLHTLWLRDMSRSAGEERAALLEGVVRVLVQPRANDGDRGDGSGGARCAALRHVRVFGTQPGTCAACMRALARDGINVSVEARSNEPVWL